MIKEENIMNHARYVRVREHARGIRQVRINCLTHEAVMQYTAECGGI